MITRISRFLRQEKPVDLAEYEELKETFPLVSVVMATYNDKPEFIYKSVESILNQTYSNFELLIMDDSDDDSTIKAIDKYKSDPRVCIYREKEKMGFVSSLNKGLSLAKGVYIARMDGDDVADIHRFEKQVRYLLFHPTVDILGGQVNVINENGHITGRRFYPLRGLKLIAFFCVRSPVAHSAVMFRRRIIDKGYRYDESLKKAEDIDFWIRLYNNGYKIENIPDMLINFRVMNDFMTKRVINKAHENNVLKIRRRNFSMKRPMFSIANWLFSYVRKFTPDSFKISVYQLENRKK